MLTRDAILDARDLRTESVQVPEWGGAVLVRVFSGVQRDRLDAFVTRSLDDKGRLKDPSGMRVLVCILACCNEDGSPLFKPEDAETLKNKNAAALDRVFQAASKLNGLSDAGVEAARESLTEGPSGVSG